MTWGPRHNPRGVPGHQVDLPSPTQASTKGTRPARSTHSCAGQSTNDNGVDEWKHVAKGTCASLGGKTADEAMKAMKK
ncbi:MAG: DUF2282 domain-containing protein [Burkholderiales bacterium]